MESSGFEIDGSPENLFQFMLDHGWSDGLPIIPPTVDRVRTMLDYTQRDASELVGYINPDEAKDAQNERLPRHSTCRIDWGLTARSDRKSNII